MSNFTTDEILQRYPQRLRANIEEVTEKGIGLAKSLIQINLPPNKIGDDYDIDRGNTIILEIPYGGKNLQLEVIFNDEDLTFAPDFDILNDPFLNDPDPDLIERCLSTLGDWDPENPGALAAFVEQLFELYKLHQIEKFLSDPTYVALQDEFLQLKTQLALKDNDVEVFIENNAHHFLIALRLDYSELPVYIHKTYFPNGVISNPGEDGAILKITYFARRKMPKLQLSPRLEDIFHTYSSFHIPPYKKDATMVEYVQSVEQFIKEKIDSIKLQFERKENYIGVLLSLHSDHVLEYDNIGFTRATFLFEIGSFACLGQICLSERFPIEKPLVTLRSMYHKNGSGVPASLVLNLYPYNPQWKVEEMVDKLLMHIRNEMVAFKTHCLNNLSPN